LLVAYRCFRESIDYSDFRTLHLDRGNGIFFKFAAKVKFGSHCLSQGMSLSKAGKEKIAVSFNKVVFGESFRKFQVLQDNLL
jgi:hypothetical protein